MFSWFFDFINLVYPEVCSACNNGLFKGEKVLCTRCLVQLPRTYFHKMEGNPVEKQFWGKAEIASATALFYFNKGEQVQHLIHRLKYKGDKEAGRFAGHLLASQLSKCVRYASIDAIVPVPLHRKKLIVRGYNQSECFAQGIGEELNIPVYSRFLIRRKATETQTRKSRYERFENVTDLFEVNRNSDKMPLHILLVDDVVTTGSTLCACADAIKRAGNIKVSVAAIAYAKL